MTERRYYLRFTLAIFATMLAILARDLTNAGVMFFAHRSLPFGTRVMFTHDGYQAVGICVDRGPYTSATYDLGPILGNELRCSGSDRVTAVVLR